MLSYTLTHNLMHNAHKTPIKFAWFSKDIIKHCKNKDIMRTEKGQIVVCDVTNCHLFHGFY